MKYSIPILTVLLITGIGFSANLIVYGTEYYAKAVTTYDWTLNKEADRDSLEFKPGPDPEAEPVVFTIDITRSEPYTQCELIGRIFIINVGSSAATITSVVDSIRYLDNMIWRFIHEEILFSGSYVLEPGDTWRIDFDFYFTTPYDIFFNHYNLEKVYTSDGGEFEFFDGFCTSPRVVNETLHVWDQLTIPAGFNYTWDYNGPWKALDDTTFTINTSFTNQSATKGVYTAKNYAFGNNECGLWMDSVIMRFYVRDTQPRDSFPGRGFTPGYWKNHPEAFDQWLPVTIATVTVTTVNQAKQILSRFGGSNSMWNKFLAFFLAMKFNCLNDPDMLDAYYNDKSINGEFMEDKTVAYIISVADGYTSSTPLAELTAMKNIFDDICNNDGVLWLNPQGTLGKSLTLPTTSSFTLVPNPFGNLTEIRFLTEVKEPVTVSVYDVSGTKVRDLVKNANSTLYWDGTDNNDKPLTRGVYIIRANNATLKALISR